MDTSGWQAVEMLRGAISLRVPASWAVEDCGEFFVATELDGNSEVGIATAVKLGATLDDFANVCFGLRPPLRKAGPARKAPGDGYEHGLICDFESAEDRELYRRMLCAHNGAAFVKVTLYATRSDFANRPELYQEILNSLSIRYAVRVAP